MEGNMKKQTQTEAARAAWEAEQLANVDYYTTSRFMGRGVFDTRKFPTIEAAYADAIGDRRAGVYGVSKAGFTIHICNGNQIS